MKKSFLFCIIFIFQFSLIFAADYVLAAEKFVYTRGQDNSSLNNATAELLPQQILNNMNSQLVRSVLPDEQLERTRYNSRKERYSLYLQLSSEYKKRDALVLNNYSDKELKKKIEEENVKIKEIEDKIQANLDDLKEAEEETENKLKLSLKDQQADKDLDKTELEKYSSLFKNLFVKDDSLVSYEDIKFYKNDQSALYKAGDAALEGGYDSAIFQKEAATAKINALITGTVTTYGIYSAVTATVYTYPGGKNIGSVTEVGSKNELDFISSSIARQLVPLLTNSMKISIYVTVEPENIDYQLYIDDALQSNTNEKIILDSGVHKIQITADDYEGLSTSYFFDGNEYYEIKAKLELKNLQKIQLTLLNPLPGTIYANSIPGVEKENNVSEVQVNGNKILGNFTGEDGNTSFYYFPENAITSQNLYYIKNDTKNRSDYIDSRRKFMYAGYSALIVSLIPTFYTNGQRKNYENMVNAGLGHETAAKTWKTAWKCCTGVSIAAGVFWGYGLVRYLLAANTVLPEIPKADKNGSLKLKQEKNSKKIQLEKEKKEKAAAEKAAKEALKAEKKAAETETVEENAVIEGEEQEADESKESELSENVVFDTEAAEETASETDYDSKVVSGDTINKTDEDSSDSDDELDSYIKDLDARFEEGI